MIRLLGKKYEYSMHTFSITKAAGFSLIELVVVLFIIGLVLAIGVPNLRRLQPGYERRLFVSKLNNLTAAAWQRALQTQSLYRLFFDMKKRMISIQAETSEDNKKNKALPEVHLPSSLQQDTLQWPVSLEIKQFFINGKNDMARTDRKVTTIWFYVVPEGMSQEVIINVTDAQQKQLDGFPSEFGLVLNPFNAQFKEYDSFQKP